LLGGFRFSSFLAFDRVAVRGLVAHEGCVAIISIEAAISNSQLALFENWWESTDSSLLVSACACFASVS
jgi:hypothetical protein